MTFSALKVVALCLVCALLGGGGHAAASGATVMGSVDQAKAAVLDAIQQELAGIEAGVGVELRKLQFNNTSVAVADFVDDETYEDYPFRAAVALEGVISSMIPEVIFSLADAISGNFAPVAESYNGGVYLYAANKPEGNTVIPTIICWKGNA